MKYNLPIVLVFLAVALMMVVCLVPQSLILKHGGMTTWILQLMVIACLDPETQWMVFLFGCVYYATFFVMQRRHVVEHWIEISSVDNKGERVAVNGKNIPMVKKRWNLSEPELWQVGLISLAALSYLFNYAEASASLQALILLAGPLVGKAVRFAVYDT